MKYDDEDTLIFQEHFIDAVFLMRPPDNEGNTRWDMIADRSVYGLSLTFPVKIVDFPAHAFLFTDSTLHKQCTFLKIFKNSLFTLHTQKDFIKPHSHLIMTQFVKGSFPESVPPLLLEPKQSFPILYPRKMQNATSRPQPPPTYITHRINALSSHCVSPPAPPLNHGQYFVTPR